MDRAHRIGQKKEVQVFRFCVESSIEEKVIEKAYKKLRLDALVIQQGRLTENTKSVNKEDLLSMVRYGAEKVFSSEVRGRLHPSALLPAARSPAPQQIGPSKQVAATVDKCGTRTASSPRLQSSSCALRGQKLDG